jgi:hypothetical protein
LLFGGADLHLDVERPDLSNHHLKRFELRRLETLFAHLKVVNPDGQAAYIVGPGFVGVYHATEAGYFAADLDHRPRNARLRGVGGRSGQNGLVLLRDADRG